MLTFDELQAEIGEWNAANFPGHTATEPFHRIVEEAGELAAALLARRQSAEFDEDPTDAIADERDAIGHMVIALFDYVDCRDLRVDGLLRASGLESYTFDEFETAALVCRPAESPFIHIVTYVGNLSRARLKAQPGSRGNQADHVAVECHALAEILVNLELLCAKHRLNLGKIVASTWATLKKREATKRGPANNAPAISDTDTDTDTDSDTDPNSYADFDAAPSSSIRSVSGPFAGRLVFDPTVSDESPVVRGTWVTTAHVVDLVVDGSCWSDILRIHPELDEADIRTCLAYTVGQAGVVGSSRAPS